MALNIFKIQHKEHHEFKINDLKNNFFTKFKSSSSSSTSSSLSLSTPSFVKQIGLNSYTIVYDSTTEIDYKKVSSF